jgi:putative endonuclease
VKEDVRQRLGRLGERLAAEHLVRLGFEILERNYRTRWGELDIVAFNGHTLAFCEVKSRRCYGAKPVGGASGARDPDRTPLESVGYRKRQRVRNMARSWLRERSEHPYATTIRFDAIGLTFDRDDELIALEHLEGAF